MMTQILNGIRVLEVAEYGFVPSAASVLGEWGADVIKVEHAARGDQTRRLYSFDVGPGVGGFAPMWEPFNRSKRAIGVDIAIPEGREVILELARRADVFITSFLPAARRKLRIEVGDLRAVNPGLVYARGSANGQLGPEAERGGFDSLNFWQRCGIGSAVSLGAPTLIQLPGIGFGDIQSGISLAGGIVGALFHRERTGEALEVDTSLLAQGFWAASASLVALNLAGREQKPLFDRRTLVNPLTNTYRTADDRWIVFAMVESDRYWAQFCAVIGHEELRDDPRFADAGARAANAAACIAALDEIFASRPLAEWEPMLARQDGQYAIARQYGELNRDEQAWANGYLQNVDYGDGRSLTLVSAPVQFNREPSDLRPAPGFGQHTDEVLSELGHSKEEIARLRDLHAIG
jgi:crotonobetainyl-CoA:carnitine CoA-transferase CaiB-like acyl-CoA transferase